MEKEKERVSKQKKMLQLKEHVARKKEMKKESNKMAYMAWQKNKKMKALAQKKKNKEDELIRAQEEAAVEALIRQKKEQKKRARLKQQQLLDKQLLLSMNDFAVSQEKQAMENLEKKKIKTMKKKIDGLVENTVHGQNDEIVAAWENTQRCAHKRDHGTAVVDDQQNGRPLRHCVRPQQQQQPSLGGQTPPLESNPGRAQRAQRGQSAV